MCSNPSLGLATAFSCYLEPTLISLQPLTVYGLAIHLANPSPGASIHRVTCWCQPLHFRRGCHASKIAQRECGSGCTTLGPPCRSQRRDAGPQPLLLVFLRQSIHHVPSLGAAGQLRPSPLLPLLKPPPEAFHAVQQSQPDHVVRSALAPTGTPALHPGRCQVLDLPLPFYPTLRTRFARQPRPFLYATQHTFLTTTSKQVPPAREPGPTRTGLPVLLPFCLL